MRVKAGLLRFARIMRIVSKHLLAHIVHPRLTRWPKLARRILGEPLSGPDRLRKGFEEIGGTLIKLGQMLALQSDMLPLEYCRGLFSLFDKIPPFDFASVERTFLEDLKQKPQEIFDSFEISPVATGSIGQVHIATLGATKLAVKIRRPSIVDDFAIDIAALTFIAAFVKYLRISKLFWIIAPTEEFVAWTQEELDYRREAHYMDELGRNARHNEFEKVPKVFWSFTTARILTVEFLEGPTISDYLRNISTGASGASPDFEPDVYAGRLIDNFLADAFDHGMFHADLHPGNLMILPGNVVGYIDFGISGVLSRYSRRHLISTTLSVARGDIDDVCDSFFRISTFAETADLNNFRQKLKERSADWYGDDGSSTLRITITTLMLELLTLSRLNGVWPQRDVIKYIRSAIALDGLIRTFSPNMDVGSRLLQTCEYRIRRDRLQSVISAEAFAGSVGGYSHLFRDGMLRLFSSLRKLTSNTEEDHFVFNHQPKKKQTNWLVQTLTLAWIVLCIALLLKPDWLELASHGSRLSYALTMAALSALIWGAMKVVRIV